MAKKAKQGKKKMKKSLSPKEQKTELVYALVVKCAITEEEVLQAYDEFYEKNKKGVIGKDEFVSSKKVTSLFAILLSFILILACFCVLEQHHCRVPLQSI